MHCDRSIAVVDSYTLFDFERNVLFRELYAKRVSVCRFEETRTERSVHCESTVHCLFYVFLSPIIEW